MTRWVKTRSDRRYATLASAQRAAEYVAERSPAYDWQPVREPDGTYSLWRAKRPYKRPER